MEILDKNFEILSNFESKLHHYSSDTPCKYKIILPDLEEKPLEQILEETIVTVATLSLLSVASSKSSW